MNDAIKQTIWRQFDASIEMLENAIRLCPEEAWNTTHRFWYIAFHSLFFLDYYLTVNPVNFIPPDPFTQSEFEDKMPDRTYTKDELLNYLSYCRKKCINLLGSLTEESMFTYWTNESKSMSFSILEILLYNMRHVQHHTAQLNFILRKEINDSPEWVFQSRKERI